MESKMLLWSADSLRFDRIRDDDMQQTSGIAPIQFTMN